MNIARRVRHEATIPTASMADIAFLLIIFFMVTTVYDVDRTNVKLPASVNRVDVEKGASLVVLHKDPRSGTIQYLYSDGEQKSSPVPGPRDIGLVVSLAAAERPDKQFIVKADGDVRYELIDELLDTIRKNGGSNVSLLTAAGASGGPSAAGGGS